MCWMWLQELDELSILQLWWRFAAANKTPTLTFNKDYFFDEHIHQTLVRGCNIDYTLIYSLSPLLQPHWWISKPVSSRNSWLVPNVSFSGSKSRKREICVLRPTGVDRFIYRRILLLEPRLKSVIDIEGNLCIICWIYSDLGMLHRLHFLSNKAETWFRYLYLLSQYSRDLAKQSKRNIETSLLNPLSQTKIDWPKAR